MVRIINYLIITIASLVFLTTVSANAELKVTKPFEVCGYLAEIGLVTGGWKNYYGDVYGCTSPYKELGSSGPAWAPALKNNLAYYVEGTATTVTQLMLVVNVNNRAEAKKAHAELLKAADVLVKKSLNKSLPANIRDTITKGKNVSSRIGEATVNVVRDDWTTGKGYGIKVIIK